MKFYEKKVKYLKFFDDAKLIEIDNENQRIAIVFFGKENQIHIFDADSYLNYKPIEEDLNDDINEQIEIRDEVNISLANNTIDQINSIFKEIQLNKSANSIVKEILSWEQEFILFNNITNEISNNNLEIYNNLSCSDKELTAIRTEEFSYNIETEHNTNYRNIKYNFYKPKIKSKLLSVINSTTNTILGIKWIKLEKINTYLLSVNEDGNLIIYELKSYNYEIIPLFDLSKIHTNAILTCPEEWRITSNVTSGKPLKDFCVPTDSNKIYTLSVDNFIMVWVITKVGAKITILANYAIDITPKEIVSKILVDKKENFIYCFYYDCFKIFKIMNKPPFHLLYNFDYTKVNSESAVIKENLPVKAKKKNAKEEASESEIESESNEGSDDDLIDDSEDMKKHDVAFLNHIKKSEFSLLEHRLIIPVYSFNENNYLLLNFDNFKFANNISSNYSFFNECIKNLKTDLVKVIKKSNCQINFNVSPFFYFNCNDKQKEVETEILKEKIYEPLLILNGNSIQFFNLNEMTLIQSYQIKNPKMISSELVSAFTFKNTILISAHKLLIYLIKFCDEQDHLGIPINPEKYENIL